MFPQISRESAEVLFDRFFSDNFVDIIFTFFTISHRPPVVAHSVVLHLEHGDHPDRLETGRCRSDLEEKG